MPLSENTKESLLQGTTQTSINGMLLGIDAPTASATRESLPEYGVQRHSKKMQQARWKC
ncbi:hypothetical protein FOXB_04280 [Fusarium oxysporum f. sp. conglutinans Fo5176]|uniref:Uncharacterized protein n=1 Tax=Fusarium oxysporum (strain Fo5176) TaxID=660025 RepID=F9FD02_FUSOF|nr:hypothetical protein FOXB_04280 [Fusarium oxysporum f. sp. conglutinans Fo5176]